MFWALNSALPSRARVACLRPVPASIPNVNVNTKPSLSAEAAMRAATGYASIPDANVSAKNELVILAVEEDGAYVYGLVWEITVSNQNLNPPQSKTFPRRCPLRQDPAGVR